MMSPHRTYSDWPTLRWVMPLDEELELLLGLRVAEHQQHQDFINRERQQGSLYVHPTSLGEYDPTLWG